MREVDLWERR